MLSELKANWKCRIGLHKWEHLESHYLPARYEQTTGFRITTLARRIHYRECIVCGKFGTYYPNPSPPRENDIWQWEEQECPWRE